jgi:hypothetical protein
MIQGFSFDITKTKAILIGVSDYSYLLKIPPALANVEDMANVLADKAILGLPEEQIVKIINKRNDEIFGEIVDFLSDEKNIYIETLLFYYAGHGIRDRLSKELYLTGTNTKITTLRSSAIAYQEVKDLIENSQVQKRIILLDACHSGLAAMGSADIFSADELDIRGSFILTSAAGSEQAYFDSTARNTFFSEALFTIMRKGIPMDHPYLSLEHIYRFLQKSVKQSTPQRRSNLNASGFYLIHNAGFDPLEAKEREGNDFFKNGDYEKARLKYYEVYLKRPSEQLLHKIEKCEEYDTIHTKLQQKQSESLSTAADAPQPDKTLWLEIQENNDKWAFVDFCDKFPSSIFREEAIKRIHALEEGEAWSTATRINSLSSYYDFLQRYPKGKFSAEAGHIIGALRTAAAGISSNKIDTDADQDRWNLAFANNTAAAYSQYLTDFPTGKFADEAHRRIDAVKKRELYQQKEAEKQAQSTAKAGAIDQTKRATNRPYFVAMIVIAILTIILLLLLSTIVTA